jgi:hypothetical protein
MSLDDEYRWSLQCTFGAKLIGQQGHFHFCPCQTSSNYARAFTAHSDTSSTPPIVIVL